MKRGLSIATAVLIVLALIGPTLRPGASAQAAPAAASPLYVIKSGDTLARIAERHRVTLAQISAANRIGNPNYIRVGQALVIPATNPAITITSPTWGSDVGNPVTLAGQSTTFEGAFSVRVLDSRYRVVGSGHTTGGSNGTHAPFSVSVTYSVPFAQWGWVEAFYASAKDGTEMETVSVRVRLAGSGPQPGPTPPPGPTPTPGGTQRIHSVARGETLYRIAFRYGVTVEAIAQANRLANPSLIYVGQRLIIP